MKVYTIAISSGGPYEVFESFDTFEKAKDEMAQMISEFEITSDVRIIEEHPRWVAMRDYDPGI